MKKNNLNLATAILDLLASLLLFFAALMRISRTVGILQLIAASCLFIASMGLFYTYFKNKKNTDNDENH